MLEIFNYWQVNLTLAILLFVIMHQNYRIVGQRVKGTSNMAVITGIIGSVVFILLIPFFELKFPSDWRIYALLLLSNVFYVGQDLLKFKSYKYLDISVISILFQISKVFFIIYGLLFFKETLTFYEMIGIGLILFGSGMVSFRRSKFEINKHSWLVIGSALAFATAMSIDVGISKQFNLPFYLLMIYFIPASAIFIGGRKNIKMIKRDFIGTERNWYYLIIAGITSAFGMLFYLLALRQGQVSIVAPISSLTVLLNVFAGYIFLKERDNLGKRVLAAVIAIIGVILLV